ncbi:MAG TPA: DUF6398 domain-containing protein [Anaerolineae bacterium]|nr:DUF6398 domain-containing protein [Anaerolineae bacterium]HPL26419.1 DUF6398 domain-containing protein [Anaerolineae bacterium]
MPYSQEDRQRIQAIREELKYATADFCRRYLTEEYVPLAGNLVDKLGRKRVVPFLQGRPDVWAAGVICTLAQLNVLFGRRPEPRISPQDIARHFRVAKTTAAQKARDIRALLKLRYLDPEFSAAEARDRMPSYLVMRGAWEDALRELGIPRRRRWG